ncbi:MAG: hypothetical protein H0U85_09985 [Gemmatimonadales bacterium]|nr:hypothetical protein [Gemmatimonadales bacterium]
MTASIAALLLSGTPGRAALPVCGLVTRAEAAAAAGGTVPEGRAQVMEIPAPDRRVHTEICMYGGKVMVSRFTLGTGATAFFHGYQQDKARKYDDMQSVPGLGDEAFSAGGQLTVRKGGIALVLDVNQNLGGGAPERAAEKRLALLALGRL